MMSSCDQRHQSVMGDCRRQMHSVNFREALKSDHLQMEKSSQSFMFEIQYVLHILTLVVSCSSQSCQASRHGFVALAMSSWALSNSPKRFAAPGGCRKLFPLHAREFPWSLLSLLLLFLQHSHRFVFSCHFKVFTAYRFHPLSPGAIFLSNWVNGYWTVCACAERPVAEHIDHVENIEIWIQSYRKMIQYLRMHECVLIFI